MISFTQLFIQLILISISFADDSDIRFAEDNLESTHGRIIFSSVLFRHGDRSPKTTYATDPYQRTVWKVGLGQLTKRGKQQAYNLGKWFRKRYANIVLNTGYRYDIFQMNSSETDRTLMSAELLLAGMFPPNEDETWARNGLRWQPIPVYMKPFAEDNVIAMGVDCARVSLEKTSVTQSNDFQNFKEEYQHIIEYTVKKAGFKDPADDLVATFDYFSDVVDTLSVEASFNMTLPLWTKKIFPEPAVSIVGKYMSALWNPEIFKLNGGLLLGTIISEMQEKCENKTKLLFHFYSSHDTTLTNILNLLNVYNSITPPLSSSILFELRERDGTHNIVVLYRNTTHEPPYVLHIPGCEETCTLDRFIEVTKELIPENWNDECQVGFFEKFFYNSKILTTVEFVILTGIFICLLVSICTLCILQKRRFAGYIMM